MSKKPSSPISFVTYMHATREYVCKWSSFANGGSYAFGNNPTHAEWNALQQARSYFEVTSQSKQRKCFGEELTDENCKNFLYSGSGWLPGLKHPHEIEGW